MRNTIIKIASAGILASALVGCATPTVISKDTKRVKDFAIEADSCNQIQDRKIKLSLEVNHEEVDARFDWDNYVEEAIELITAQGVILADDGLPVTITIEKYKLLGSSHLPSKSAPLSNQLGNMLGAGLGTIAAATFAEAAIGDATKGKKKKDNPRLSLPILDISIKTEDGEYENLVKMTPVAPIGDYVSRPRKLAARASADFFAKTETP